ncbi:MAG: glycosyltransferase family 4 protein [Anaerolineales bacterium]
MTKHRAAIVRLLYYPDDMLVRREAEALRDGGFAVTVFGLRRAGERPQEVIEGVEVRRLPLQRQKRGALRNLLEYLAFFCLAAWHLTRDHLHHPFTAIQVNTMPDFLVFATLIPRLLGAKVTLMMYEPMPELWATKFRSPLPSAILRHIARWSVVYAHAVITVTQALKDNLVAHGAAPGKITVVLNVPDPASFGPELTTNGAQPRPGELTLICHGAIEERYGHDTMVQAMGLLRDQWPGLRLIITGDGGYRDEFEALVRQAGLEARVHSLGYLPWAELVHQLRHADVGVVAQKASPYSHLVHTGKMYDFLALGKPVLASRLDAVQTYFDDASLSYFEPDNSKDLARAISELMQCPERRRSRVEHSQKLYGQYRGELQREIYLSVYRRWQG